jgi:sialate O-acetylesterase
MAWMVSQSQNPDEEQAAANLPLIRMFTDTSKPGLTPQSEGRGQWAVCSPATVGKFSATLFFFGREIHRELGVPVGLINSSVGGTLIQSWIAPEAQLADPALKPSAMDIARRHANFDPAKAAAHYQKALARWQEAASAAKAAGNKRPPRKPHDPVFFHERKGGLGGLFNGKISPWIPCALRGILWYQGEGNARGDMPRVYQRQLELLVGDWRARWGEELPFAWVQLPNLAGDDNDASWMLVREATLKALRLPRTGMAVTVDIGDPKDIHPKNKQDVGRRLSLWALGEVYGREVPATSGPLPAGHEIRGSEMVVSFKHTAGGLRAKDGAAPKGFLIAGPDHQWLPADARIDGDKVVLSNSAVAKPVAVRYAWARNPDANLINSAGLPASPFRTDDFEIPAFPDAGVNRKKPARPQTKAAEAVR